MKYLQDYKKPFENYKNWPLSSKAFAMKFKHFVTNPKPLQPKETQQEETHIDYYVSPRKFIRYVENQGSNFTYAENFRFENLIIVT